MVKNAFPVDKVRPLIAIPEDIPQIGFLGGEQGRDINDSIKRDYRDFSVMQQASYSNGKVIGSNPFYVVGVQAKIPSNVRVATQSDLENAMKIRVLDFSGTYEDTGLVLRSEENPNSYLASNLMEQIKERLGKKARMPVMIPLYGMELAKDQNSPHGLAFKLKEDAEIIYAPILNKSNEGSFNSKDIKSKTGLPTKVGNGNRTLWTRNGGLSRLYLNWYLDLYSSNFNLADSDDYGRVVLVSTAEGVSQDFFNKKLSELQKIKDERIAKINEDYIKAEKILRGIK